MTRRKSFVASAEAFVQIIGLPADTIVTDLVYDRVSNTVTVHGVSSEFEDVPECAHQKVEGFPAVLHK